MQTYNIIIVYKSHINVCTQIRINGNALNK